MWYCCRVSFNSPVNVFPCSFGQQLSVSDDRKAAHVDVHLGQKGAAVGGPRNGLEFCKIAVNPPLLEVCVRYKDVNLIEIQPPPD